MDSNKESLSNVESKKCCIAGCFGLAPLLPFPNPKTSPGKFTAWISFTGVDVSAHSHDFNQLFEEYKEKRMCNLHFSPITIKARDGKDLILYTVPTLYGPNFWRKNKQNKKPSVIPSVAKTFTVQSPEKTTLPTNERILRKNIENSTIPNNLPMKTTEHTHSAVALELLTNNSTDSTVLPVYFIPKEGKKRTRPKSCQRSSPTISRNNITMETRSVRKKISTAYPVLLTKSATPNQKIVKEFPSMVPKIIPMEMDPVARPYLPQRYFVSESTYRRKTHNGPPSTKKRKIPSYKEKDESDEDSDSSGKSDSDNDYEVEYLDSETENPDIQENTLPEIEYLDMSKFTLEDNNNEENRSSDTVTNTNRVDLVVTKVYASKTTKSNTTQPTKSRVLEALERNINEKCTIKEQDRKLDALKTYSRIRSNNRLPKTLLLEADAAKLQALKSVPTQPIRHPQMGCNNLVTDTENQDLSVISIEERNKAARKEALKIQKRKNNVITNTENTDVREVLTMEDKERLLRANYEASRKEALKMQKQKDDVVTVTENTDCAVVDNIQEPTIHLPSRPAGNVKPIITIDRDSQPIREDDQSSEWQPLGDDLPLDYESMEQVSTTSQVNQPTECQPIENQPSALSSLTQKSNPQIQDQPVASMSQNAVGSNVKETVPSETLPTVTKKKIVPQVQINDSTLSSRKCAQFTGTGHDELKREITKLQKELSSCKTKLGLFKARLEKSRNILTHKKFLTATSKMQRIPRVITTIMFRETLKNKKIHRFTKDEKELAFLLDKQCGAAYNYLIKMGFILPHLKTVRTHDVQVDFESALKRNDALEKLKAKVDKMSSEDRLCMVIFDEKLIHPANRNKQVLTAIGNAGEEVEVAFEADHALIFMVKGILKYFEDPVSYSFSLGPTNGTDLALQIKSVISDLQAIGYIVLATVCDQAESNRTAIEILVNETRSDSLSTGDHHNEKTFKVNHEEVIALFDPPHLLKGIRNHLISKNLSFEMDGVKKTAKWKHLEMLLHENPGYNNRKLIPKLTICHVYPTKLGIKITKYASQIFSQTVATYMGYFAEKGILPPESSQTADLLLFFDSLFDSLNNCVSNTQKKKPLLAPVKFNSVHLKKWTEAIQILKTMSFVNNGSVVTVPDIDCWIWTLEGYLLLMHKLLLQHNVESVWMRHLNQDVLENSFKTEINPSPNRKKPKSKEAKGLIITQKVIKAINRINKSKAED